MVPVFPSTRQYSCICLSKQQPRFLAASGDFKISLGLISVIYVTKRINILHVYMYVRKHLCTNNASEYIYLDL